MTERTLLQIVTAACDELGLPRPVSLVGSQDAQSQQFLALANREGAELAAREGSAGGWPRLRKEHVIVLVAGQDAYDFPSDLQYFINTTAWDRSNKWPLQGPISPATWQVLKSGTVGSVGPRRRFRIMAGLFYIDPVPGASEVGQTLVIEYYSNGWCESSGGVAQTQWATDGDRPTLPDDAFILGLKWRYLRAKRLDYAEEFNEYEAFVERTLGRSTMASALNLAGGASAARLLNEDNIPDSGYGGV